MNRLKSGYMQGSLFVPELKPYIIHEHTPFKGSPFLPDDFAQQQDWITQDNRLPAKQFNRLNAAPKSSKIEALINGSSTTTPVAPLPQPKNKLSVLSGSYTESLKADLERKRAAIKTEMNDERLYTKVDEDKKNQEHGLTEQDIFKILQPTNHSKSTENNTKLEPEEASEQKVPLSTLAKTMKQKKALKGQNEIKAIAKLVDDPKALSAKLREFYNGIGQSKTDEFISTAIEFIQTNSFDTYQATLIEKYGKGIELDFTEEGYLPFASLGIETDHTTLQLQLKQDLRQFYNEIGEPKDDSFINEVIEQIEDIGIEEFNKKLIEKYGRDLKSIETTPYKEPMKGPRTGIFSGVPARPNIFSTRGGLFSVRAGVFSGIFSKKDDELTLRDSVESIQAQKPAKKQGRLGAVLSNIMNFRPGRSSISRRPKKESPVDNDQSLHESSHQEKEVVETLNDLEALEVMRNQIEIEMEALKEKEVPLTQQEQEKLDALEVEKTNVNQEIGKRDMEKYI